VFLLEPERTAYDLNWRMFGIPIRVHPMFWLVSVIMGWSAMREGFAYLLLWVACVFVSILIHEMGHVLAYRAFGAEGNIVLYSFGGLAISYQPLRSRWQRIAVSFAGPWAGFVFLGLVIWLTSIVAPDVFAFLVLKIKTWLSMEITREDRLAARPESSPYVFEAVWDLFQINLFWGLLNLLPIWPLDGGKISRELFEAFVPDNGTRIALGVSGVVAGLLALNTLMAMSGRAFLPFFDRGDFYLVLLFGLLAVGSFQAMQQMPTSRPWREDYPSQWDKDRDHWDRDRNRWER
jgi:Zn-dependent protease